MHYNGDISLWGERVKGGVCGKILVNEFRVAEEIVIYKDAAQEKSMRHFRLRLWRSIV